MHKFFLSKDTQLFVSIAAHPSNFGTTLFNAAFQATGYNAVYKALQVKPGQAQAAIAGLRALGVSGCGVSMPFKQEILPYLDWINPTARTIGAVNTIVNRRGRLRGYNTDYFGAKTALQTIPRLSTQRIVLLGDGGVAAAITAALVALDNRNVIVVSRSKKRGQEFVNKWKLHGWKPWRARHQLEGDLLINATPVGMDPHVDMMPVMSESLSPFSSVMDVIINPLESNLLKAARQQHKQVIPGYFMSLHQAAKQFELYTGQAAPLELMQRQIKRVFNS